MTPPDERGHDRASPVWDGLILALGAVAVVLVQRRGVVPFAPWGYLPLGVIGGLFALLFTAISQGSPVAYAYRFATAVSLGAWVSRAGYRGLTRGMVTLLVIGAALVIVLGYLTRHERLHTAADADVAPPPRTPQESWQADISLVLGRAVQVERVQPWARREDGERVHLLLPPRMAVTDVDPASLLRLQAQRHLPPGCQIRVGEGDHQGSAVLDVMLRDSLADAVVPEDDADFSAVSIYDPFPVMWTPRREPLSICLRRHSAVIGAAPDMGKTTLLHRIMRRLARCRDAMIWVIDLNGGGLAEPWIGEGDTPVVDWVAGDEYEAAALTAVAVAVAKDRKTSPVAIARRRAAGDWLLPVDASLPAIVVVTDEGGEMQQAVSTFGRAAAARVVELAQIGRAEAVRVVMSVLRGTSDLLEKRLRVAAAIRIALRMLEEEEYSHVLGAEPGRGNRLVHRGAGYLMRDDTPRPLYGRTADIARPLIEATVRACAPVRPRLDERAVAVAATVTPAMVLGRAPTPEELRHPVLVDAQHGHLYTNRWRRYAQQQQRVGGDGGPPPTPLVAVPMTPAVADLERTAAALGVTTRTGVPAVDLDDPGEVDAEARRLLDSIAHAPTVALDRDRPARAHILAILAHTGAAMTSGEIGAALADAGVNITREHRQALLKRLRDTRKVVRDESGTYRLP